MKVRNEDHEQLQNIALSGKHKPADGQTTPTMHIYHSGSHD